ncbi:hypothetical protein [Oscillatoria sp. HE19RPO]|nr:hypothetical protein [Oscillatoria sp. HE19RPO]
MGGDCATFRPVLTRESRCDRLRRDHRGARGTNGLPARESRLSLV